MLSACDEASRDNQILASVRSTNKANANPIYPPPEAVSPTWSRFSTFKSNICGIFSRNKSVQSEIMSLSAVTSVSSSLELRRPAAPRRPAPAEEEPLCTFQAAAVNRSLNKGAGNTIKSLSGSISPRTQLSWRKLSDSSTFIFSQIKVEISLKIGVKQKNCCLSVYCKTGEDNRLILLLSVWCLL